MAISLEELDGRRPSVDEAGIRTLSSLLQTREDVAVLVGEPELASHQTVLIFGLGEVGKHSVGIEVERIDVIDRELALDAWRVLPHREVYARAKPRPFTI